MRSIPFFDDHYPVRTVFTGKKDIHQCGGRDVAPDVEEFSAFMNMPLRRMLFAKEAHSGSVCVVTEQDPEGKFVHTDETWSVKPPGGYDSVITNDPEILLCLRTAAGAGPAAAFRSIQSARWKNCSEQTRGR